MMGDLNSKSLEELKDWNNQFHSVYKYNSHFWTKTNKHYSIGNKESKVCKYCGLSSKDTNFKKAAHIIPKFMGNLGVKDYNECDKCNSLFGDYETNLASFIGLPGYLETAEDLERKRRRVYKHPKSEAEFYPTKRGLMIYDLNNTMFEEVKKDEVFKISTIKNPYVPIKVYKAFIKMTLSTLTNDALNDYEKTLEFLLTTRYDLDKTIENFATLNYFWLNDFYMENPLIISYNKKPEILEFEQKNNVRFPDKTFLIYYRFFLYQIFIPFDRKDNGNYKRIYFYWCPPIISDPKSNQSKAYLDYFQSFKNLSSVEKLVNEKEEFYFHSLVKPELLEYTEEEYNKLKEKYKLRH